jgi:hypothetical protein
MINVHTRRGCRRAHAQLIDHVSNTLRLSSDHHRVLALCGRVYVTAEGDNLVLRVNIHFVCLDRIVSGELRLDGGGDACIRLTACHRDRQHNSGDRT